MSSDLVKFNSNDACTVSPTDIPVVISKCFSSLKEIEDKVAEACAAAEKSLREAKSASGKTINCIGFGTKDAVYALQTAVEAGAVSQTRQQEVLDRILAFQQATANGMKYLFRLGAQGIAANRAVSKAIRDRMQEIENGDATEFDEYVMSELASTLVELKRQEDLLIKQEKLNDVQRAMREEMRSMNDELAHRVEDIARQEKELKKQADKDVEHDAELLRQAKKDQEHDNELRRQADKDKEHDAMIGANAKGVEHNKENILINAREIAKNAQRIDLIEEKLANIHASATCGNRDSIMANCAFFVSVGALLISIACVIVAWKAAH